MSKSRESSRSYVRCESEEEDAEKVSLTTGNQAVDLRTSNTQSFAKPFHATISRDRTDQEALEGHRLVALQQKPELKNALDSVRLPSDLEEREDREKV